MTAIVTRDETRAFVEHTLGRSITDEELDTAHRIATCDDLFADLSADDRRFGRVCGILA